MTNVMESPKLNLLGSDHLRILMQYHQSLPISNLSVLTDWLAESKKQLACARRPFQGSRL